MWGDHNDHLAPGLAVGGSQAAVEAVANHHTTLGPGVDTRADADEESDQIAVADQTGPGHKIQNIAIIGFLNIVVLFQNEFDVSMLPRDVRVPEVLAALRL